MPKPSDDQRPLYRRLTAPAAPNNPVPSRTMLVGSGTAAAPPVTVP